LDLSLGANMALAGILCGMLIKFAHFDMAAAIAVSLAASLLMGVINGYIVAYMGVNPLITTLATGFVFQGVAVWLAGPGFTDFPASFLGLGQSKFLGIQLPIWYMAIAAAVFHVLMTQFRFFRKFYFVGASKRAALMSGINARSAVFATFIIAAVFAGLGGIISASRFNSSMTSVGTGVELRAVTAAVIGGVSFTGGAGTVLGAVLGALFLAFVNNGLIILGIEPSWQNVVIGFVLILSIVIDVSLKKKD
jgi:ribose transport system permease protein